MTTSSRCIPTVTVDSERVSYTAADSRRRRPKIFGNGGPGFGTPMTYFGGGGGATGAAYDSTNYNEGIL